MTKRIEYNEDAREGLLRGANKVANAVKITLGSRGRNAIIEMPNGEPKSTKDGVSVAREVNLEDKVEQMGARMIRGAAEKTVKEAGDGTTTATILAQAILNQGIRHMKEGANPMDIKIGIDKAVARVVEFLDLHRTKLNEEWDKIRQIGTVSANGDAFIGNLVAQALEKTGLEGHIGIEETEQPETTVEYTRGYGYDGGLHSTGFINRVKYAESELKNAYVLVTDKEISLLPDILPIVEKVVQAEERRPLVIISPDVNGEALAFLAANNRNGKFPCMAIKAPGFGITREQMLEDIALVTGATVINDDNGLLVKKAEISHLGKAGKVVSSMMETVIMDGAGESSLIEGRVEQIRSLLAENHNPAMQDHYRSRIAKLTGGVAVISVGGKTQAEVSELRDRVEDAMFATKAALEEGIIVGGGAAYLRALKSLEGLKGVNKDQQIGINIIRNAIQQPFNQILHNAGKIEKPLFSFKLFGEPFELFTVSNPIVEKVMESDNFNYGYNARKEVCEDLVAAGIIDPVKVTKVALKNAASVMSLLLTTEVVIVNKSL